MPVGLPPDIVHVVPGTSPVGDLPSDGRCAGAAWLPKVGRRVWYHDPDGLVQTIDRDGPQWRSAGVTLPGSAANRWWLGCNHSLLEDAMSLHARAA